MTIATVIICFNEAEHIQKCIESVLAFSDEIIVVDSFSTDSTLRIVNQYPVRAIQRVFTDYIDQKNFANSLATSDYIFSLDADEYASDALIQYLCHNKTALPDIVSFPRLNKIGSKEIPFGTWYPDRKIRLWKRPIAQWGGTIPHETLLYSEAYALCESPHHILHDAYPTIEDLETKSIRYAELASFHLAQKYSIAMLVGKMIFGPCIKLVKGYIVKQGFRNGMIGWLIEKNIAWETYKKYTFAIRRKLKNELKK